MSSISVIIPVYNVEAYVEKCVRSVLDQTFRDLEVICVDSISTDNSPLILQRLAKEEKNHYEIWKKYTGVEMKVQKFKVFKYESDIKYN